MTSCSLRVKRWPSVTSARSTAQFRPANAPRQRCFGHSARDPNCGIAPQQVLTNYYAGKYRRIKTAHFVHRQIAIGFAMRLPGSARLARHTQTSIVNETQDAGCSQGHHVKKTICQTSRRQETGLSLEKIH